MFEVRLVLDEGLRFFVASEFEGGKIRQLVRERRSVKDMIESLGIPHVEAGRVRIDGREAGLSDILFRDCVLEVFSPEPLEHDSFVLDVHLGKLSANLRMLGFFTDYSNDRDDAELADISAGSGLCLLSCDRRLLMRSKVSCGMLVRSRDPLVQAAEVVNRFGLSGRFKPFSRCINCGAELADGYSLESLPRAAAAAVPPGVRSWAGSYMLCPGCGRPYWKGSHFEGMYRKIDRITELSELLRRTS